LNTSTAGGEVKGKGAALSIAWGMRIGLPMFKLPIFLPCDEFVAWLGWRSDRAREQFLIDGTQFIYRWLYGWFSSEREIDKWSRGNIPSVRDGVAGLSTAVQAKRW